MNDPMVCAICLTADRPELTARAVKCFREQTYENRFMLVLDSGETALQIANAVNVNVGIAAGLKSMRMTDVIYMHIPKSGHRWEHSIGSLRNSACQFPFSAQPDIFAHFDSDDWSAPNRIEQQVRHLEESGADAVGYNEMLFWRSWNGMSLIDRVCTTEQETVNKGDAWLYSNQGGIYTLGTSLCYWRKTWENKPFPDLRPLPGAGEDKRWLETRPRIKCDAISALPVDVPRRHSLAEAGLTLELSDIQTPMMVAEIHGSNSSSKISDGPYQKEWKRVPEWDSRLGKLMRL